jgi:predicted porin
MLSMYAPAQPLVAPMNSLDSAADNTVGYLSPSIGGFNGQALYSFGEVAGQSSRKRYSVGGIWANGPFAVGLSVEQTNIPNLLTAGVAKMQNLQSGASFDLGVAKLFGQYAKSELTLANGKRDFGTWQLGTSVPVGAGAVLLSYVQTKKDEPGLANVKRKTLGLGYDYNLSKRTDLYAVYLRDSVTPLASGTTAVVGMRHRF